MQDNAQLDTAISALIINRTLLSAVKLFAEGAGLSEAYELLAQLSQVHAMLQLGNMLDVRQAVRYRDAQGLANVRQETLDQVGCAAHLVPCTLYSCALYTCALYSFVSVQ